MSRGARWYDDSSDLGVVPPGTTGISAQLKFRAPPRPAEASRLRREAWARAGAMLRLVAADGRFLHMSGEGLTREPAYAWMGTRAQLGELRRLRPATRRLRALRYRPEQQGRMDGRLTGVGGIKAGVESL